jgi:hypothetical protein
MTMKPGKRHSEGLFSGIFTAYSLLILHVVLIVGLVLLVIFFRGLVAYMLWIFLAVALTLMAYTYYVYRRAKREGKGMGEILRASLRSGRSVEVSLLGGLASFKVGQDRDVPMIVNDSIPPSHQLEDPDAARVKELTELARMLEKNLITREEFDQAKRKILP